MTPRISHRIRTTFGLSLVLILLLTPASALAQGTTPTPGAGAGYYYIVRPGDTWTGIAATVGVSIPTIQMHNQAALHPHNYLWIGDRLWIPAPEPVHATTGYWYTIKRGHDWNYISGVTGVPVSDLKAANPIAAADPNGWLYVSQKIWIPTRPPTAATAESTAEVSTSVQPKATPAPSEAPTATAVKAGYWYDVKPGDDWYTVYEVTGVPVHDLKVANPIAARDPRGWLYIGQQLWIPTGPAVNTSTPAAAVTEAPAMAVVGTATPSTGPEATPEPITAVERTAPATVTPATPPTSVAAAPATGATSVATESSKATPAPEETPPSTPEAAAEAGCPKDSAAYPAAIAARLNGSNGDIQALKTWLQSCGVITDKSGDVFEIRTSGADMKDVAVVLSTTPAGEEAQGRLLIYHSTTAGYTLVHQVEGAGEIELLEAKDLNADSKPDLVYTDTSCGAHTCFRTLFVDSWNGSSFEDWIKGEPTMAGAAYSFEDTVPGGQGLEILAHGGVINSTGAGPQRAWTETYISPEGGSYESYKKAYDASSCLYFQILDANELFNQWNTVGFAPAIAAYEKAIADKSAGACGEEPEELTKLADFGRFQLMVALIARGQSAKAAEIRSSITYEPLVGAANTFVKTLQNNRSIVQACRDTTHYAEQNTASWDFLSDWGYANPTFTAADLCPLG